MKTEPTGVDIDGSRVRHLRKMSGDNLIPFAHRVGITFQYLSQIETGVRRSVSPAVFKRICIELGIPANERHTLIREEAA